MTKKEKDLRKQNKERALEFAGYKCQLCGYNKCIAALEFHHKDKSTKSFSISNGLHLQWRIIKKELNKCVLVCANCHREIEEGMVEL